MQQSPYRFFPTCPLPNSIYVLRFAASFDEQVAQTTLAGCLTAISRIDNVRQPALWLDSGVEAHSKWLDLFLARTSLPVLQVASVWDLVKQCLYSGIIKGYIIYDSTREPSLNVATSLCAKYRAVAISSTLLSALETAPVLFDARNVTYGELLSRFTFDKSVLCNIKNDMAHLRDFAVAIGALVTSDKDSNSGYEMGRKSIMPGGTVLGWGYDEWNLTNAATNSSLGIVAADWCLNLHILMSGLSPVKASIQHLPVKTVPDSQKRNIAFIVTDGDNLQWTTAGFATDPNWFGATNRGKFPVGWGLPISSLSQLAPDILRWYFDNKTGQDDFIAYADSYAYLDSFGTDRDRATDLYTFLKLRLGYANHHGCKAIATIMHTWASPAALQAYKMMADISPDLLGVFSMSYAPYAAGQGRIAWATSSKLKRLPVLSPLIALWDLPNNSHFGDINHTVDVIKEWADRPVQQPSDRFTWIAVHAWSTFHVGNKQVGTMQAIEAVQNMLSNSNVVCVKPTELLTMLHQATGEDQMKAKSWRCNVS